MMQENEDGTDETQTKRKSLTGRRERRERRKRKEITRMKRFAFLPFVPSLFVEIKGKEDETHSKRKRRLNPVEG